MNPYEAPQIVETAIKDVPPKRRVTWGQIALICAVIGGMQVAMYFFRAQERERKHAALKNELQQLLNKPLPLPAKS